MKASEFVEQVNLMEKNADACAKELSLFVKVINPNKVGGTPCVKVTQIESGFDWDQGKVLIETEQTLTSLSPEDVKAINESVKLGNSWHAYQQYKLQKEEVKTLEAKIAELTKQLSETQTRELTDEYVDFESEIKNGFKFEHHQPWDALTSEANEEYEWSVIRTKAPFFRKNARVWSGRTPRQALDNAKEDLNLAEPVSIHNL